MMETQKQWYQQESSKRLASPDVRFFVMHSSLAPSIQPAKIRGDPMGRWAVGPLVAMFTDGDCVGIVCHAMLWYWLFL